MKNYRKKGMTLVEMMVAIAIFTIGIAGFTELFMRSWRSNAFIMEEAQATRQGERTLNEITRDLREIRQGDDGSFAINLASDFGIEVFSDIDDDGVTEKVHYYLDQNNDILKKGISKPSGTPAVYPAGDDSVTDLSNYVVNELTQPLFVYYDKDGNQLSATINLADISLIKSNVWINIKPITAPENVNFETVIQIRNLSEIQ